MAKPSSASDRSPLRAQSVGGAAFAVMACVALCLALTVAVFGRGGLPRNFYASQAPAAPPGDRTMVKRAVFAQGRLWLLSEGGAIWTIRPSSHEADRMPVSGAVLDLCIRNGNLVSVSARRDRPGQWVLAENSAGGWLDLMAVASQGDTLAAVQCEADGTLLVTTRRVIEIRGAHVRSTKLSEELPVRAVSSVVATPDTIYVGLNAGEWGGGLRRIDRREGTVSLVESRRSQGLCDGPLNSDCDPVTALIPDPSNSGCVIAAVGLVHMTSRGSVLQICRDVVRSIYAKPCEMPLLGPHDARTRAAYARCSEAFFGLVRAGDTLWAASNSGLYRRDGEGAWTERRLPKFKSFGAFMVSFDSPSLVFLLTEANRRYSLSGATPLMISR